MRGNKFDDLGVFIDDITYVVDNASICVVEDNYVKALSNGTTKVRVIYKEQEYICIVRVG